MTPEKAFKECLKINKRILSYESIICQSAEVSLYYAQDIIKGPWEPAELKISKSHFLSYNYATKIIKGPFEKCYYLMFINDHDNNDWKHEWKSKYIDFLKSINYNYDEWLI